MMCVFVCLYVCARACIRVCVWAIGDGGGSWAHIQWVSPSLMSGASHPVGPPLAQGGHNSTNCRLWYYKYYKLSVCVCVCVCACVRVCVRACIHACMSIHTVHTYNIVCVCNSDSFVVN